MSGRSKDEVRGLARRETGDHLRAAIAAGEVVAYYQPIVDMRSGRVLRLEALARWPAAAPGWTAPARFLPLAERSGLMGRLFAGLLERALCGLAVWRGQAPDLRVSLNLSAPGLMHRRLMEQIRSALYQAAASPDWLSIEVTEETVLRDFVAAHERIARLRALGIRVEIDDFGTGYSSLRYLQMLAVDSVKIDRQFVEASVSDHASKTIVRAVVGLCHELGLEAVAEGVADQGVWDLLAGAKCDSAQGHLVAAAMPGERVASWLGDWAARTPVPAGERLRVLARAR